MIARRLRLAFLNVQAAQEALPTIVNIMAEELNWSNDEKEVDWIGTYLQIIIKCVLICIFQYTETIENGQSLFSY